MNSSIQQHLDRNVTLPQALDEITSRLETAGIEKPRLTSELALAHVLDCPRLQLPARYDESLTEEQCAKLERCAERLALHEPVQYVLEEAEFMGHRLRVDQRALVPRPETEVLVECVLECSSLWEVPHPEIADVGTGTGCIAIALAKAMPQATYIGIDISETALALACENAVLCDVADLIQWRKDHLLGSIHKGALDAVIANLPYIPSADLDQLPANVKDFEPHTALDGGASGISVISRLVEEACKALKSPGWLFLETGEDQARDIADTMQSQGWQDVEVIQDLTGRDRIVSGKRLGRKIIGQQSEHRRTARS